MIKEYKRPIIFIVGAIFILTLIYSFVVFYKTIPQKKAVKSKPSNTISGSSRTAGNSLLKTACAEALIDYPKWARTDTDLIIWENPDKTFHFRNAPEEPTSMITSPIEPKETLVDMDFVGEREISYVTIDQDVWKIGLLKLKSTGGYDKSLIYERNESLTSIHSSPVGKNEYIVLAIDKAKSVLKQINTVSAQENIIKELPPIKTTVGLKLALSPKGTYFYLLENESLSLFDTFSKKEKDKIDKVNTATWIGNGYLLYSGANGTYVYDVESKEKSKLDNLGSILNIVFNPADNGVIAYNEGGNVKVVNCQTWMTYNIKQDAELKTLVSYRTAITKKGDQSGYWRFKDASWDVKILEEDSKFITIWQRY